MFGINKGLGKLANIIPAKRLSKRNIASGLTDKIYMSRTEEKGKHLNVNVIIDTSGSIQQTIEQTEKVYRSLMQDYELMEVNSKK